MLRIEWVTGNIGHTFVRGFLIRTDVSQLLARDQLKHIH